MSQHSPTAYFGWLRSVEGWARVCSGFALEQCWITLMTHEAPSGTGRAVMKRGVEPKDHFCLHCGRKIGGKHHPYTAHCSVACALTRNGLRDRAARYVHREKRRARKEALLVRQEGIAS